MARIQSLTTIPSVSNTDVLAIEHNTGTGTYKVPISMLLSDVYRKSEAVAKADIVDNLTSTAIDKPGSANMLKTLNDKITPLAPDNSKTQINFNAQQVHTIDLGVTPSSEKNVSVLLIVAGQGILSEINCAGNGAVKTDFGTALSSVSLSGSTLTINFASRPWGLCVTLIYHN